MAPDDPSGPRPPVVLRIKLRYDDVEAMVARFAPNVGKSGLFIPTRSLQPIGADIKFELRLTTEQPVLVGLGRVRATRAPDPDNPKAAFGMAVELLRVTRDSRDVILKMLERRRELGLADVQIPSPDDVEAARRADFLDSGVSVTPAAPVAIPIVESAAIPELLTSPRRSTGPIAVAKTAPVQPLAPEPPRRRRVPVHELIESAADAGGRLMSAALPGLDDEAAVDIVAALARARALAVGDLDAELEALRESAASPVSVDVEAASAELARQLGGVAVRKGNGKHVVPDPAPVRAPVFEPAPKPPEPEAPEPEAPEPAATVAETAPEAAPEPEAPEPAATVAETAPEAAPEPASEPAPEPASEVAAEAAPDVTVEAPPAAPAPAETEVERVEETAPEERVELEAPAGAATEVEAPYDSLAGIPLEISDEDRAADGYERDEIESDEGELPSDERRVFGAALDVATEGRGESFEDKTVAGGPVDPNAFDEQSYATRPSYGASTLDDELAAAQAALPEDEPLADDDEPMESEPYDPEDAAAFDASFVAGVTGQAPDEGVDYGGYQGGYSEDDVDEIEELDEFEIIAEVDESDDDLMTARAEPTAERRSHSDFAARLALDDNDNANADDEPSDLYAADGRFEPSEFDPQISSAGRALAQFDDEAAYRTPSSGFEQPVTPLPGSMPAGMRPIYENESESYTLEGGFQDPAADDFDSPHAGLGTHSAEPYPGPRFDDSDVIAVPIERPRNERSEPARVVPYRPPARDEDEDDAELEHALEALDVDIDDLSETHERPPLQRPEREARPVRRPPTDDGIVIDFDDDE